MRIASILTLLVFACQPAAAAVDPLATTKLVPGFNCRVVAMSEDGKEVLIYCEKAMVEEQ